MKKLLAFFVTLGLSQSQTVRIQNDFWLDSYSGKTPGLYSATSIGHTTASSNEFRPVWDNSVAYTFPSTAGLLYASSTSGSDTGTVTVAGLIANPQSDTWTHVVRSVNLTGQSSAVIPGNWIRVNSAFYSGASTQSGEVYVYTTSPTVTGGIPDAASTQAHVTLEHGAAFLGRFSTSSRSEAFVKTFSSEVTGTQTAECRLRAREYGAQFRSVDVHQLPVTASFSENFFMGSVFNKGFGEKSDFITECRSSASNRAFRSALSIIERRY